MLKSIYGLLAVIGAGIAYFLLAFGIGKKSAKSEMEAAQTKADNKAFRRAADAPELSDEERKKRGWKR